MAIHNELWETAEQVAAAYLETKGWYIRHSNWRCDDIVLDIVCIDADMTTLLFVIVCKPKGNYKINIENLMTAVSTYVQEYHLEHLPIRFDRIIISEGGNGHSIKHDNDILPTIDSYFFYEQLRERQHLTEIIN